MHKWFFGQKKFQILIFIFRGGGGGGDGGGQAGGKEGRGK